jgi:hypothetical protein
LQLVSFILAYMSKMNDNKKEVKCIWFRYLVI